VEVNVKESVLKITV